MRIAVRIIKCQQLAPLDQFRPIVVMRLHIEEEPACAKDVTGIDNA